MSNDQAKTSSAPAGQAAQRNYSDLHIETKAGRVLIKVEVARTEAEKTRGLMFRSSLAKGTGMLFPYGKAQELTMWMRNTYIPLDMIFIRTDGRIHRIARNTEPLSEEIVASHGDVIAVLEIAGSEAEQLGLSVGDKVVHPSLGGRK